MNADYGESLGIAGEGAGSSKGTRSLSISMNGYRILPVKIWALPRVLLSSHYRETTQQAPNKLHCEMSVPVSTVIVKTSIRTC